MSGWRSRQATSFKVYSVKGGIWLQIILASVLLFLSHQLNAYKILTWCPIRPGIHGSWVGVRIFGGPGGKIF